jgi:hypothetical protein
VSCVSGDHVHATAFISQPDECWAIAVNTSVRPTAWPGNGPFVVYLDAWQREVTYLQDPDLVERALGVDTTGRLQTVWQVRMLDVSKVLPIGITCTTSLAPWDALVQPAPSRLSSAPFPTPNPGPAA